MTRARIEDMSIEQLVATFAAIGVAQDVALLEGAIAKFNRLFGRMVAVADELKRRPGDQRRELRSLYAHSNMQVRLKAAKHTLAVDSTNARRQLEEIAASNWYPQAGDAAMSVSYLEDGTYKPA